MAPKLYDVIYGLIVNPLQSSRGNNLTITESNVRTVEYKHLMFVCKKDYNNNTIEIPLCKLKSYVALDHTQLTQNNDIIAIGQSVAYDSNLAYTGKCTPTAFYRRLIGQQYSTLYIEENDPENIIYLGQGNIFDKDFNCIMSICVEINFDTHIIDNIVFKFNKHVSLMSNVVYTEVYNKVFKPLIKDPVISTVLSGEFSVADGYVCVDFGKIENLWHMVELPNDSEVITENYYGQIDNCFENFFPLFTNTYTSLPNKVSKENLEELGATINSIVSTYNNEHSANVDYQIVLHTK